MKRARIGIVIAFVSGCTVGNVRSTPEAPSKYDTRKLRHDYTMKTAIDPTLYLNSLMRRAHVGGCSAGVAEGMAIIECSEAVHLQLTPKDDAVEVACFAISIAECRKEIARLEALPDPKAAP